MKKTRKVLAALLSAAMVMSLLSACGGGQDSAASGSNGPSGNNNPGTPPSKTFTMTVSENLKTLDPHYQTTLMGKVMTQMYLESLLLYDETTGEFFPWLCESYEYSDDGLTWTFHMRDGIKFSDGEVLDANDVVYSFERLMNDKEGSPIASQYWAKLEKVELVDNLTVKLVTSEPLANMRLCLTKTYIIPDEAHKSNGDDLFYQQKCPGSGPWVLAEWVDGQRCVFTKNPNYWNKDWFDSYFERVEVRMMTESATAITAHVSGDVQAYIPTGGIDADMLALYSGTENRIGISSDISGTFVYAGMSFREGSPFRDENVRWAFEYAVDRQSLVDNVLGGGSVPKSEALELFGENMGYDPDLEPYQYDPKLAREYLGKSSYKGEPIEIVTNNGFAKSEEIALFVSECLNEVGFNTNVKIVEVAELMSIRAEGTYDMFLINNMNGSGDLGNDMMQRLVQDTHHSFFEDAEPEIYSKMAEPILAQSRELDVQKRADYTREAMRVIRENAAPHSYLCQYESAFAIDYGITGLEPFADGTLRFTFVTYDGNSDGNVFPDFSPFIK